MTGLRATSWKHHSPWHITHTTEELTAKIEKTKTMITSYEDAILALSNGAQLYSLDTGQTKQTVQRSQLSQLKTTLEYLERRLDDLCARQRRATGAGLYVRPGF